MSKDLQAQSSGTLAPVFVNLATCVSCQMKKNLFHSFGFEPQYLVQPLDVLNPTCCTFACLVNRKSADLHDSLEHVRQRQVGDVGVPEAERTRGLKDRGENTVKNSIFNISIISLAEDVHHLKTLHYYII